jgi:hypothetical protein
MKQKNQNERTVRKYRDDRIEGQTEQTGQIENRADKSDHN